MKKLVLAALLSATSMTAAHAMPDYSTWSFAAIAASITEQQEEVSEAQTDIAALQALILAANANIEAMEDEMTRREAIEQGPTYESYARDALEGDGYVEMVKGDVVRFIVEDYSTGEMIIRAGHVNGNEISTASYDNLEVNFASAYFYLADRGFSITAETIAEMQ